MRTEIGGYFGLELNPSNVCFLHSDGYCVNSGKNALRLIVEHLSGISKIWLPYYTCEVILELIQEEHIPYEFYSINRSLEMAEEVQLHEQEYLLLTNYFGIKDKYILDMAAKYGDRLIVDNAQAFFCEPIQGIKTIYSPRKYVGVPDGGIAFGLC